MFAGSFASDFAPPGGGCCSSWRGRGTPHQKDNIINTNSNINSIGNTVDTVTATTITYWRGQGGLPIYIYIYIYMYIYVCICM